MIPYFKINIEAEGVWTRNRAQASADLGRRHCWRFSLFLIFFQVYAVLVPTLLIGAADVLLGRQPRHRRAASTLAGFQAALFLDHDVVSVAGDGADGDRNVLPRPGLVVGVALERSDMSHPQKSPLAIRKSLFGDSARAFGTLSAVLLLLLAIVPAKDYFREWRGYQKQYLRIDSRTRRRHFAAAPLSGRTAADLDAGTGVVDRCATCHVGAEGSEPGRRKDAAVPAAPADPAQAH